MRLKSFDNFFVLARPRGSRDPAMVRFVFGWKPEVFYLPDQRAPPVAVTLWLLFPVHIGIDPGCGLRRRGVVGGLEEVFLDVDAKKKEGESTVSYFLQGGAARRSQKSAVLTGRGTAHSGASAQTKLKLRIRPPRKPLDLELLASAVGHPGRCLVFGWVVYLFIDLYILELLPASGYAPNSEGAADERPPPERSFS